MQPELLVDDAHLRTLLVRWRAEERSLREILDELAAERDQLARQAVWASSAKRDATALRRRHDALSREHDDAATELLHVRLALLGATEELDRSRGAAPPDLRANDVAATRANTSHGLDRAFIERRTLLGA